MIRHAFMAVVTWFCLASTGVLGADPASSITGKDGARMLLVPAGAFLMGSGEGNPDETPPHRVDLPAFYMDEQEVTGAQYSKYLEATGATPPPGWNGSATPKGFGDRPVTQVSWTDAMKYAIWAGKRLPTEAEWEKAARGTDGRRFPWGRDPVKDIANVGTEKIRPVRSYPKSASPYGCQDMAGNVWEWTADWYLPYPGTSAKLIHFGKQYKVMRGGGADYFYTLNENTGRCALRGRILPYAGEDNLGFRCAADVPGAKPAYDPRKALAEAEQQLKGALPKPATLSYETEYEKLLKSGSFSITVTGKPGQDGMVRGGVPFPQGLIKDAARLQVMGADGKSRALQTKVLTPWKDGSARWVLLDFPAETGEQLTVRFGGSSARPATGPALNVHAEDEQVTIDTGKAVFVFAKDGLIKSMQSGGKAVFSGAVVDLLVDTTRLHPLPAEVVQIDKGSLRATVWLQGWFGDETGKKSVMRYDLRASCVAGSSRANLLLTITHMQARTGKTEERTPMARIADASVRFALPASSDQCVLAMDGGVLAGPIGGKLELLQPEDSRYAISRDGKEVAHGTRAPGWTAVQTPGGWFNVGVRHFWQNYAKAIAVTPKEVNLRLWAGAEPVEFEATMAKTHEIVLEVADAVPSETQHLQLDPLRLSVSPAWTCGTQALGGPMIPRCAETMEWLPYWELAREGGMKRFMRSMCYSWRDFGDTRHGGETKGANAFHNLEYDMPFNFELQYFRTGHTWYLDAAEVQCRHQADIDTDHVTGQPYKHERFHASWYADFAHMFLRGLVLQYWATGDDRSFETARMIADHIAPRAMTGEGFGNERQIGWGLYALTGFYEATQEAKYLESASALCDRLVSGMSPNGKFNIRWDNRMSLMNGMAMNGMMSVQELTGDEKLAEGLLRLSRRTLGFYPEYSMRTLHGYAWALTRTNDPRYMDVLDKTWRSCMELTVKGSDAADAEVHAWRFPWFVVKYRLFPLFDQKPALLPDYRSWQGQWLPGDSAEMYIRKTGKQPAPVLALLDGIASGTAELFDDTGKLVQKVSFEEGQRLYQPAAFTLPEGGGTYRLRLKGYGCYGWELHHDARTRVTYCDPKLQQINVLCPRGYCYLRPTEVEIEAGKPKQKGVRIGFEAIGEGVHSMAIYDPKGNIVAATEKYMPLEDKNRYELSLGLPVEADLVEGWSIDAWQAKVLDARGFLPYWASSPEDLFNPDVVESKK